MNRIRKVFKCEKAVVTSFQVAMKTTMQINAWF